MGLPVTSGKYVGARASAGAARGGSYEDETDEGPRLERAEVMVS